MKCEYCQADNDGSYATGRFCSKNCSKSFSTFNKRNIINDKVSLYYAKKICKKCNTSFSLRDGGTRKHCHNCRPLHVSLRSWEEITDKARRSRLIKERGIQCESCGFKTWLGEDVPLHMDHINGNSDDSRKDNLRLLCPNCHTLTPTYGAKNIGKVKSKRSKKMKEQRLLSSIGRASG